MDGSVKVKCPMWRIWPGWVIETRAERTVKIDSCGGWSSVEVEAGESLEV